MHLAHARLHARLRRQGQGWRSFARDGRLRCHRLGSPTYLSTQNYGTRCPGGSYLPPQNYGTWCWESVGIYGSYEPAITKRIGDSMGIMTKSSIT